MTDPILYADCFVRMLDDLRSVQFLHYAWRSGSLGSTPDILTAVMRDASYRRTFLSPNDSAEKPIHGPYQIDALSPQDFHAISGREAMRRVRAFLALMEDHKIDVRSSVVVDRELQGLDWETAEWLALEPDAATAMHELGWIHTAFVELVCIQRTAGLLALVVMVID